MSDQFIPDLWTQQNRQEFVYFLAHIAGARSILEVGSCLGRSLWMMALVANPGAVIRSIDLGVLPEEAGKLKGLDVSPALAQTRDELSADGFDVKICLGNSHDEKVIAWARDNGPYDVVFIDGDHSYEGAKADWLAYGPMGRIVGFHDIAHPQCGVRQLWSEIKSSGHATTERVATHMGIGIIMMPEALQAAA